MLNIYLFLEIWIFWLRVEIWELSTFSGMTLVRFLFLLGFCYNCFYVFGLPVPFITVTIDGCVKRIRFLVIFILLHLILIVFLILIHVSVFPCILTQIKSILYFMKFLAYDELFEEWNQWVNDDVILTLIPLVIYTLVELKCFTISWVLRKSFIVGPVIKEYLYGLTHKT